MFLDDQAIQKNQPLDTGTLHDLTDGAEWLRENRGNHAVLFFNELPIFDGNYTGVRPFASAAGFASIAQIPWFRAEGLVGLRIRWTLRVSSALRDRDPTNPLYTPRVLLRAGWVSGRLSSNIIAESPAFPITPEYQTIEFDFPFPDEFANQYDVLSLQFFSVDDGDPYDPDTIGFGLVDTLLQGPMRKNYIRVGTSFPIRPYIEVPPPAPSNSLSYYGPNEITASVLAGTSEHAPGKFGLSYIGTVDHVGRWGDDDEAIVWPPLTALTESGDAMRQAQKTYKRSVGYAQFAHVEIEEVFKW